MQAEGLKQAVYKNLSRIFIHVKAKPGSKKQGISQISESEVAVCIRSPPVEGKANTALIEYFAEIFNLPKSDVRLEKGGLSKNKLVSIADVYTEEDVLNILNENLL
jgi:uncharacterized protein (TIGR00251 family)